MHSNFRGVARWKKKMYILESMNFKTGWLECQQGGKQKVTTVMQPGMSEDQPGITEVEVSDRILSVIGGERAGLTGK